MHIARNFESRVYTIPPSRLCVMNYIHNSPHIIVIVVISLEIQYYFFVFDFIVFS